MRFITKILTAVIFSMTMAKAHAIEPFVVQDIQVEGLQRIELGTFFTALPIRVGETLDDARTPNIIRSLYKTGNFDFVKLEKEGDTLKISVVERPVLAAIVIVGNKVIKTEQIEAGLESSGVVEKETLNQFVLSKIRQEITDQYFSNGKYEVKVTTQLAQLSRNRVNLTITVDEGGSAVIGGINIVGNSLYSEDELKKQMELTEGNIFSVFSGDNKYSSVTLDEDIETLESYYRDRGYLNFKVGSTGVALSEDKKQVYVTLNVDEGKRFYVKDVSLLGDLKIDRESLERLVPASEGDVYSEAIMKFAEEQIKEYLGFYGYTFAQVRTVPEIMEETNEVSLKMLVNPGEKFYLNQVNFIGSAETDENVFRREIRLKEGEPISSKLIERSKLRLQRLPFVENVKVQNKRIASESDKLDLEFEMEERGAAQIAGSLGYNDTFGLTLQGNLSHNNFLGEGKNAGLGISYNKAQQSVSVNYGDPYFFDDGVGFSSSFSYKETNFEELNIFTGQSLDTLSIGGNLFYQVGEFTTLSYGLNLQDSTLKAPGSSDQRVIDFFDSFGVDARLTPELDFLNIAASVGWEVNKLNRGLFPTRGFSHKVGLEVGTPAGDLEYYKFNYGYKQYFPIAGDWIFSLRGGLGYGEGLGDSENLPYFKNFYGGNAGSLRGFEPNTVGPRSIQRFPTNAQITTPFPGSGNGSISLPSEFDQITIGSYSVGGNASAVASMELIFPNPLSPDNKNLRSSLFVDVGNVWDTNFDVAKFDGFPIITSSNQHQFESVPDFSDSNSFRISAGVSIQWWSPLGPLLFSVSTPIQKESYDRTKTFSFSIGQTF